MSTITKGNFSDGHKGWKVSERKTNGVDGFEIHWSDDGECVTDHVYTRADADLIASAPELLRLCEMVNNSFGGGNIITFSENDIEDFRKALNKL